MGTWGEYDDENDDVLDAVDAIKKESTPKFLREIEKDMYDVLPQYTDVVNAYLRAHPQELYAKATEWIGRWLSYMQRFPQRKWEPQIHISGIVLALIRLLSSEPVSGILNKGTIPKKLPTGFPEYLRKQAMYATETLLERADENILGWVDVNKRKKALKNQYKLFSQGKKRSSQKASSSRKSKSTRKPSKRPSKPSKNKPRQGPEQSATLFKLGTKKQGNDGKLWIVVRFNSKSGRTSRRWERVEQ